MKIIDEHDDLTEIGILMLDTGFERVLGDIGNVKTWPFPVRLAVVDGTSARQAICGRAEGFLQPCIEAAQVLIGEGVSGITTSCGFLSILQNDLAAALPVPVAASSLMQAASINAFLPDDLCVGIVTFSAQDLSETHLRLAGVPVGTPVAGMDPQGEFVKTILNNLPNFERHIVVREILEAADRLRADNADIGAILLECTNMAPYAHAVRRHTGLPVFSMYSFLTWFHSGLSPRKFMS